MGRPVPTQRLGRYTAVDVSSTGEPVECASGAVGSFYRYEEVCTEKRVAIKRIPLKGLDAEQTSSICHYLQHDIMRHFEMRHPQLIKMRDVFLTDNHLNIVLDLAEGGSLIKLECKARETVGEAGLSLREIRWYFQQLIITLDYLHRLQPGIIHDIRLEDLLLAPTSSTKDGGLYLLKVSMFRSEKASRDSRESTVLESDPYTSPEQLHGAHSSLDPLKVDVWRAGIILYVLMVGGCPPAGEPLFHCVPSPARDLVQRMLHPDPCQRIDFEGIKQHPWFLARLPPGALEMNDTMLRSTLLGGPVCARSRSEVRAIADGALHQLASARDAEAMDEWSADLHGVAFDFPSAVSLAALLND